MYRPAKKPKPIEIREFLGLNTSVGETEIKLGESVNMRNFRITKNFKPEKRKGHNTFINYNNTKNVYGAWYGTIGSKTVMITCNDGKVYEYDFTLETNTQIGTITDARTSIQYFEGKLYFMNGTDYKEYNGTTYQDVQPYIPTISLETTPAGVGTDFEEINLLTGYVKQSFVGNGTAAYTLRYQTLDAAAITATVNGVAKVETTDFTVNRTTGILTFTVSPPNEASVVIQYSKTFTGNANLVKNHRFMTTFGPSNSTNIFIWGNSNEKNTYRVSGMLKANYFPALSFYKVSSNDFAITDMQPQNDRLLIFKENMTHYTLAESNPLYTSNTGLNAYIYTSYDLNRVVGNVAYDGVQVVENNPVSLKSHSVWEWVITTNEDERNAQVVSDKVKEMLDLEDLSQAITYDYQTLKELWINIGSLVYIWNYGNDTWYVYDNIEATWFLEVKDKLYYGTKGKIEVFGSFTKNSILNNGLNDNNTAIRAIIELGFTDFGENSLTKNSKRLWVTIQPQSRTSVTINYETDQDVLDEADEQELTYYFLDFNDVDFNDFPFTSNPNPQGERVKIRAKKYQYIKFIFENDKLNQGLTILNFLVQAETANYVK